MSCQGYTINMIYYFWCWLDHLAEELFVKFVKFVKLLFSHFAYYILWKGFTMYSTYLRTEYLYTLFRILPGRLLFYSFSHLYKYGLTIFIFILWVIIEYFTFLLKLFQLWSLGTFLVASVFHQSVFCCICLFFEYFLTFCTIRTLQAHLTYFLLQF